MEDLYNEYQYMLNQMKGVGFYEAMEWHSEISKFKEKHRIKGMYGNVMKMEDGTLYKPE